MDSVTVRLMAQMGKLAAMHSDSLRQASEAARLELGQWLLLRSELFHLAQVTIPSVALVVCVILWRRNRD